MTLLIIADDEDVLRSLPFTRADILISCGDLPDETILKAAARCGCRHILAVKGNHDSGANFPSPIIDLHLQSHQIEGLSFGGFRGSWKYKPRGHYLYEQLEVHQSLATFPPVDLFVAHNSPRLIHDREDGIHPGFEAFTSYVERARPRLLFHGHQHLNVESTLFFTRVLGTYGYRYVEIFPRRD